MPGFVGSCPNPYLKARSGAYPFLSLGLSFSICTSVWLVGRSKYWSLFSLLISLSRSSVWDGEEHVGISASGSTHISCAPAMCQA